jgi:hypothetical protein
VVFCANDKDESSKFEVEKFRGKNNFEIWKLKIQDLLVQLRLQKALVGNSRKSTSMTKENLEDLHERALNTICLYGR